MTAQLSRDRLEEIIGVINAGAYGYSVSAEEIGTMARMLLAGMEQTPFMYGIADPDGEAHLDECCVSKSIHGVDEAVSYLNAECTEEGAPLYQIVPLYRQPMPPTPVAVDEIAEQAGIDPDFADAYMQGYHDAESRKPAPVAVPDEWRSVLQEMVNAMLAYEMDVGEPAPYKHRKMMMRAGHLLESHRAAMQAEPVTAATVPAGWKLVPVEPTAEMIDAHVEGVQTGGMQKGYRAMLAAAPAAPEQEV